MSDTQRPGPDKTLFQQRIKTYSEFWPYYLGEHSKRDTRTFHVVGTLLGIVVGIFLGFSNEWYFAVLGLIPAYSMAWYSHFFIEKNRPATFRYPLWSFISDFRMIYWVFTGRL